MSEVNSVKVISSVRFQNFIVFEPQSFRVPASDILLQGPEVQAYFETILSHLSKEGSLQDLIITNRLSKIGNMLSLVTNFENVIITKFMDKIWKRYAYMSNLGETFLDMKTYHSVFPEEKDQISDRIAQRINTDTRAEFSIAENATDDSEHSETSTSEINQPNSQLA